MLFLNVIGNAKANFFTIRLAWLVHGNLGMRENVNWMPE